MNFNLILIVLVGVLLLSQFNRSSPIQDFTQPIIDNSDCPLNRSPGGVTFGPTDFGTPNSNSEIGPVPACRHFTYNNDLTKLTPGQPPDYQNNCYQFPCPEGYQGTDVCYRCGDKPWASANPGVDCPTPKSPCQMLSYQ